MLRILPASDLHIDINGNGNFVPPRDVDFDVAVIAGDVAAPMTKALPWVAEHYASRGKRVFYTPGNHCYYVSPGHEGTYYQDELERGREMARSLGITLLQNEVAESGGVRFAGATLFTDFACRPAFMSLRDAMSQSQRGWIEDGPRERDYHNDFREIRYGGPGNRNRFTPSQWLALHRESRAFFERVLSEDCDLPTVCISHMPPTAHALGTPATHDWLYSNSMDSMLEEMGPHLWIHGHVHRQQDHIVGRTRILANPRGYPLQNGQRENPDFDARLVVEVGHDLTPGPRI